MKIILGFIQIAVGIALIVLAYLKADAAIVTMALAGVVSIYTGLDFILNKIRASQTCRGQREANQ